MGGSTRPVRKPRLVMVLARALLVSLLVMILAFAISLLLAIAGLLVVAASKGGSVDMRFAYRQIAAPVAIVVLLGSVNWPPAPMEYGKTVWSPESTVNRQPAPAVYT